MYKNKIFLFIALLMCFRVSSVFAADVAATEKDTVRIYAASSLTNVLNALITKYQTTHSANIVPIYAGSSSLARQIEQGAPADLFISANELWVKHLEDRGVVNSDDVHYFTANHLVVIAPDSSTVSLEATNTASWLKILGSSRLALGQPNAVPAGIYAKQSLEALNLWSSLRSHLAPTNNVRNVLTLVERGEAPLGIVYLSDAKISNKVKIVHTFADSTHEPIRYPLVQITQSAGVLSFMQYLLSDEAKVTLQEFGFN